LTREQYSVSYNEGYPVTVRFLLSRGLPLEGAQEAAQGAWAKGWEYREHLRNPKKVVSWVNTIALNLFRNGFRRRESPGELPEMATAPKINARAIDVRRTLEKCPSRDRRLIEMTYIEGYTSAEIGKQTGSTPVAVRVRLLRARRKLAAELQPERHANSASKMKAAA
jgi:RNA polymerase sigma-70 factor (ECF subfamily)